MSESNKSKKKVVVTTTKKNTIQATTSKITEQVNSKTEDNQLLFGKENYKWMIIGFALVLLGMFLMMGGRNPSPEVWDEGIIYSTRRTLIAPLVILAGLIVEVYAIFKKA